MDINILEVLSYTVVTITVLTMIFGVIAYSFYKIRESRRNSQKSDSQNESDVLQKDEYLFFEEKEIL